MHRGFDLLGKPQRCRRWQDRQDQVGAFGNCFQTAYILDPGRGRQPARVFAAPGKR